VARDLVCLSHLRWDLVYQRPNHLMSRAARDRRVFFVEEPRFSARTDAAMSESVREGVRVLTPELPESLAGEAATDVIAAMVEEALERYRVERPVLWYLTPMALPWSRTLEASARIYDSMDNLAGFLGAPPELLELERELLSRVDLVFCGGASLHARMTSRHDASHCFPSSIDVAHFRRARDAAATEPEDQRHLPGPRIGYAGVIDERLDLDLIDGVAAARPEWQIVLLGPIVKIDASDLPDRSNVRQLGPKPYADLPSYLAGWQVGWMPFARNAATRYISPTKTPEYLAAGLAVVSTSIHDVVEPYGRLGFVAIADTIEATVAAMDVAIAEGPPDRAAVDRFLSRGSWDRTWLAMSELVESVERRREPRPAATRTRRSGARAPERTAVAAASRPRRRSGGRIAVVGHDRAD
jgi:UDP-galactopyranose mutase